MGGRGEYPMDDDSSRQEKIRTGPSDPRHEPLSKDGFWDAVADYGSKARPEKEGQEFLDSLHGNPVEEMKKRSQGLMTHRNKLTLILGLPFMVIALIYKYSRVSSGSPVRPRNISSSVVP